MYGLLLAVLVLLAIFLCVVILLQSGKGGGLAAMGGGASATDGILAGRQATTVLTRSTWIAGMGFMVLALVLSIMSSRARAPESIIRPDVQTAPTPEPILPGVTGSVQDPGADPGAGNDDGEPPSDSP